MLKNSISRRNFLKAGPVLVATGFSFRTETKIKVYHIGLQLNSIREAMLENPVSTLESIAKIGYKEVEHAHYIGHHFYGFQASEFSKILKSYGLAMPTSQTIFRKEHWLEANNDVSDSWKKTIEDALIIGQEYLFSPWFDWDLRQPEEMKRGIAAYEHCGEICRAAGLRFGFHNHSSEFEIEYAGAPVYEYMLDNWDLTYVCQQMDLCNMVIVGADPMYWLRRYPHQFESMHVKDKAPGKNESTLLGAGTLDLESILAFAKKHTPVKYWVIEQESFEAKAPLESAAYNLRKFKEYGFI